MMDTIKCGENLKRARKQKGIGRQKLANQLGLSDAASISNWENGKNWVGGKYRDKVMSILELAESEFVPTIGYVYVFYYLDAESKNDTYPCKIGHTITQSVEHRVKWKVKSDWQEKNREYKIALRLSLPIDECKAWEGKIHDELKAWGRWINKIEVERLGLKGKEWFYTTPDEVKSVYEALRSSLAISG